MLPLKYSILVAALAFGLAYWLNYRHQLLGEQSAQHLEHMRLVARQMAVAENYSLSALRRPRIAVGLGACVDIVISANDFWSIFDSKKLAEQAPKEGFDNYPEHLRSMAEFRQMFGFFFKQGAAAERYLENQAVFSDIIARLKSASNSVARRFSLGGNAPTMANRLAGDGADVLLGATLTPEYRAALHRRVILTGMDESVDYHVSVEYEVGDEWSGVRAPRANRFIFHRDQGNSRLTSLPDFRSSLTAFRPDVLVIGGLQLMDGIPYANSSEPEALLSNLGGFLSEQTQPLIHFEMASFADADMLKLVIRHVLSNADSVGLNEQELPNLVSVLETGKPIVLSAAYPRVATMLDLMRRLYAALRDLPGGRHVSRIHLHTLGFQAILTRSNSRWVNSRSAAARAALVAHRFTCSVPDVDVDRAKLLMDDSFAISEMPGAFRRTFNASEPVSCWTEPVAPGADGRSQSSETLALCVAPGLVCTRVRQTGGAGDNISAAGLSPQVDPTGE
ncbi:hypothetical protein BOX15_Mlig009787g2 [Macrostomum lignano]|uniref:ADP-dependent glucokinase n=1 Tax=Macrostomum lignano TaxID=282301 RepID=A0A267H2N4_9PLAT|nr:hypothetical protein BOX15_Mlig009787g2 [Macrostomum lignano]